MVGEQLITEFERAQKMLKSQVSQSLYNLKDAAKMLNFLQANNIMDMAGLDEKFKSMIGEQLDIQHKLKPIDRRLGTLKKHIEQAEIYFKYKEKKKLTEAEPFTSSLSARYRRLSVSLSAVSLAYSAFHAFTGRAVLPFITPFR